MLIGFLGKKGHGKDTCADFVCSLDQQYQKIAIADALKRTCIDLFDLTELQVYDRIGKETVDVRWNKTPRKIMQEVATYFKDTYGSDFWINIALKAISVKNSQSSLNYFVISDVRFQEEIDKIHEAGGVIIKVLRPCEVSNDEHISEKGIDFLSADYFILNDKDLEKLMAEVGYILSSTKSGSKL